jgi:UDP-glucose:(heptosyl)LPS alpha-1,3-glucosyltransferase
MKIALCHERLLPDRGGCETYIAGLLGRLAADGHQLHLYASQWDDRALPASVRVHPIDLPSLPRFWRPWAFSAALLPELRRGRHDVSLGFDKVAGVDVLYPQGGVYAATADHNQLKYRRPLLRRLAGTLKGLSPAHHSYLALERRQYAGRPLVVAISDMVRRHCQHYLGVPAEDLRILPIAPAPDRLAAGLRQRLGVRNQARQRWGLSDQAAVALFVGLNYRLKGLEPLLRALARLERARAPHLLVVGKPDAGFFPRLSRRLGLADRVRFAGYCPDMRDAYFAADFLVHPTFYDPCSNVVLEALACGLPVITSRYNGASELLEPPAEGYVIDDPHDHARLAWCIEQLLDPARRAEAAAAAQAKASAWRFEDHYAALVRILEEAAGRRHSRAA